MSVFDFTRPKPAASVFALSLVFLLSGIGGISDAWSGKRGISGYSSGGFQGLSSRSKGFNRRGFSNRKFNRSRSSGARFGTQRLRHSGFRNSGRVNSIRSAGVSLGQPLHVSGGGYKNSYRRSGSGGYKNSYRRSGVRYDSGYARHISRSGVVPYGRSSTYRNDNVSGALVISVPSTNGGNYVRGNGVIENCPENFNCGQRLYANGTGPRIIRIRPHEVVGPLPEDDYDTPNVITFEEIR